MDRIVTELPVTIPPLTEQEKQQALETLKKARLLREAMLARRKGKLVPDSTPLIREAREEYRA